MYINNKQLIKHLFQNPDVDHVIISANSFCTYANAIDSENNIIDSLNDINVTIDNENVIITEYDENFNVRETTTIPLTSLAQ